MPPGSDRAGRTVRCSSRSGRCGATTASTRIEAVVTTHYHDDHVAGLNLLRDVEGTEVWSPANVAPMLEDPHLYDLPCLWYEPIPVDRVLGLGETVRWHEYELTVAPAARPHAVRGRDRLRGRRPARARHRRPAGRRRRRAATIAQLPVPQPLPHRRLRAERRAVPRGCGPSLIISGHWAPREVDDAYLRAAARGWPAARGAAPRATASGRRGLGAEGFAARM